MMSWRKVIALVPVGFLGSVLIAIVGEATLRLLDRPKEEVAGWAWRARLEESNEFGFRGRRESGGHRTTIVLLGDSQVETTRPLQSLPEGISSPH